MEANGSSSTEDSLISLDTQQIKEAVSALYSYVRKDSDKNIRFLNDDEKVNLQLTFKKVPHIKNQKIIQIDLPHALTTDQTGVCLFVRDVNKKDRDYGPTVNHFKELLDSKNVHNISEIIPLKALKTEYKPYEAKKNLSNKFDAFLADETIMRFLPSYLGKNFYGRKRIPIQVNLDATSLAEEIHCALHGTRCLIGGHGSCCMVTVGHTGMTEENTVENVLCVAKKLAASIPGGSVNVRNLYVKMTSTPALPIYVSLGSANEVQLPKFEKMKNDDPPEDVTTVVHGKVKVSPYGAVTIVNKTTEKNLKKRGKPKNKGKKQKNARLKEDEENTYELVSGAKKNERNIKEKNLSKKKTVEGKISKDEKMQSLSTVSAKKRKQSDIIPIENKKIKKELEEDVLHGKSKAPKKAVAKLQKKIMKSSPVSKDSAVTTPKNKKVNLENEHSVKTPINKKMAKKKKVPTATLR